MRARIERDLSRLKAIAGDYRWACGDEALTLYGCGVLPTHILKAFAARIRRRVPGLSIFIGEGNLDD